MQERAQVQRRRLCNGSTLLSATQASRSNVALDIAGYQCSVAARYTITLPAGAQMDIGDWQEFSRLRGENHHWHRCIDEILEAVQALGATPESIARAVERSVGTLNQHLVRMRRRPVELHRR